MRCVVVRRLEDLPDDGVEPLVAYVAARRPTSRWSCTTPAGSRARRCSTRSARRAPSRSRPQPLKKWELPEWVVAEFRRHKARDRRAAAARARRRRRRGPARPGGRGRPAGRRRSGRARHRPALVRKYFGGRAEVKGFAVADAAIEGKACRGARAAALGVRGRVDPVLVTSAVAGGLRGLARYMSAPRGLREADLAREVGVPPWKLKSLAAQSRGWSPRGLAVAIQAAAQADADVKGAAGDRLWACERLVISVSAPAQSADRTASRRKRRADPIRINPSSAAPTDARQLVRAMRRAWRSPTSCSRPGSCGSHRPRRPCRACGSPWRRAPGLVGLAGLGGLAEAADRRLERRLDRLVALVRSVVLLVALDLGLDVRHGAEPLSVGGSDVGAPATCVLVSTRDLQDYQRGARRAKSVRAPRDRARQAAR